MGPPSALLLAAIIATLIAFTHQQDTPEERCATSGSGRVCLNCFQFGTCVDNGDGTFSVIEAGSCSTTPSNIFCDDSKFSDGSGFGQCAPLPVMYTDCGCSEESGCVPDPNDPRVVLHCDNSPSTVDPPCPYPALNLDDCGCLTCTEGCPFIDDPNDSCANYYVCSGANLIPLTCTGTSCFDQASCGCVAGPQTTLPPTKDFSSTALPPITIPTCPADCPFLDDPNDSCGRYFVCSGDDLIPINCVGTSCFDQSQCGCVKRVTTTTPPATTILTCPSDCPLVDDPYGDCGSYFVCSGGDLLPVHCTGDWCFDQTLCGCVERIYCNSDCPFVDDPNGDCRFYFFCNGDSLIPYSCPENLCFDQTTCTCL